MLDIQAEISQQEIALKKALDAAQTEDALEKVRINYLGRNGHIAHLMKSLKGLPVDQKRVFGPKLNALKQSAEQSLAEKKHAIFKSQLRAQHEENRNFDVTAYKPNQQFGGLHIYTHIIDQLSDTFMSMGYNIVDGPELETDYYNFEALNIPSHHPARAMHDTFYFGDGTLLRTHTSPVQIRAMENNEPPFRLIAPGRVYRCDSDVTHTPMFHQIEGLYIDKQASFAGLKSLLKDFFQYFFEKEVALRFRPSYFPFTEPSAEVDIACTHCDGQGCRICKKTGWLEVMGCGMVHPNVLKAVNIDAKQYGGWAFGMGIDRLAMLRYGIDDLRTMFESDLKFLRQFSR